MVVTPIYAAVLALLFVYISLRVIAVRRDAKVSVGDGGDRALMRRQRVQANFAEYAPFALLLMAFAELQNTSIYLLHLLGLALLAGRALHAFGMSSEPDNFKARVLGMQLTFGVIVAGAVILLINAVAFLLS